MNSPQSHMNYGFNVPLGGWLVVHPWRAALILILIEFALEVGIMMILPQLPLKGWGLIQTAAIDACLLSVFLLPALWCLVVSPLNQVAECRRSLFEWAIATEERKGCQISRDLHDGVGQLAASLDVGLAALELQNVAEVQESQIRQLRRISQELLLSIRQIARGLRPQVLDDLGISAAIHHTAEDISTCSTCRVHVHLHDIDNVKLPEPVETTLFRIMQEAVTNAQRHGQSKNIEIETSVLEGEIEMIIQDDGIGFDVESVFRKSDREERPFGLISLIERACLVNGTAEIRSRPGQGTRVHIRIPLTSAEST